MAPNEEVILTWQPNRRCRIRHIKDYRFEVMEVENAKLCVGDTFDCPCIINGEKLIVDNLCHKGIIGLTYVAGKQGGVFFERVRNKTIRNERRSLSPSPVEDDGGDFQITICRTNKNEH